MEWMVTSGVMCANCCSQATSVHHSQGLSQSNVWNSICGADLSSAWTKRIVSTQTEKHGMWFCAWMCVSIGVLVGKVVQSSVWWTLCHVDSVVIEMVMIIVIMMVSKHDDGRVTQLHNVWWIWTFDTRPKMVMLMIIMKAINKICMSWKHGCFASRGGCVMDMLLCWLLDGLLLQSWVLNMDLGCLLAHTLWPPRTSVFLAVVGMDFEAHASCNCGSDVGYCTSCFSMSANCIHGMQTAHTAALASCCNHAKCVLHTGTASGPCTQKDGPTTSTCIEWPAWSSHAC